MIEKLHKIFQQSTGVSIDTRTIQAGQLFFALSGPNFNGNLYAEQAMEKGAIAVVIDQKADDKISNSILVEDSLQALQKLANYHRRQVKAKIIALTGSNGKTTTKELLSCVLSEKFAVQATRGNLNNHIGVPLSLLEIDDECQIAIIEMGANHQQEISVLCNIAEPDFGLITNIGKAHLEGFGGIEGVAKGKLELFDFIHANGGTFFANIDDQRIAFKTRSYSHLIEYDTRKCRQVSNHSSVYLQFDYNGELVDTRLTGGYNLINISAAITIAEYFGVEVSSAIQQIKRYNPTNNRSQFYRTNNNELVLDHYNANPSSMKVSLEAFSKIRHDQKMVILGEMAELGDESEIEHQALVDLLVKLKFRNVLLIGQKYCSVLDRSVSRLSAFKDNKEAIHHLNELGMINHLVLLKGSRSSSLEELIPYL